MPSKLTQLTQDPPLTLLLKIGIPSLLGQLILSLYNTFESVFVGQAAGDLALIGLSNFITTEYYFFSQTIASVAAGAAVLISKSIGENDLKSASEYLAQHFLICILHALLTPLIFIFWLPTYIKFLGVTAQILPFSLKYGRFMTIFGPFSYSLSSGFSSILKTQNMATFAMARQCASAVVNLSLDALFLYQLKSGVEGAAWASCAAYVSVGIFTLCYFFSRFSSLSLKIVYFKVNFKVIGRILWAGFSVFVQYTQQSLLNLISPVLIKKMCDGDEEVQLLQLINGVNGKVLSLFSMPINGLQQGIQPVLGASIAGKNYYRVYSIIKISLGLCIGIGAVIFVILMIFAESLVSLFTKTVEIYPQAAKLLRFNISGVVFSVVQNIAVITLQAEEKFMLAFLLQFFKLLISLFWALFMPRYGKQLFFFAFAVGDIISGVVCGVIIIYFLIKYRKLYLNVDVEENQVQNEPPVMKLAASIE